MEPRCLSLRIVTAPANFARVECFWGCHLRDAEWKPMTEFMQYSHAVKAKEVLQLGIKD